jgi:hypothetical protein
MKKYALQEESRIISIALYGSKYATASHWQRRSVMKNLGSTRARSAERP